MCFSFNGLACANVKYILQQMLIKSSSILCSWGSRSSVCLHVKNEHLTAEFRSAGVWSRFMSSVSHGETVIENNTQSNQLPGASVYYSMTMNCNHNYLQRDWNNPSKQLRGNAQFCCYIMFDEPIFRHPFLRFCPSEVFLWDMSRVVTSWM